MAHAWWRDVDYAVFYKLEKERDEARAEVERLRAENKLLRHDADKEWGAVATACADVAKRQREACAEHTFSDSEEDRSAVLATPLVTHEES